VTICELLGSFFMRFGLLRVHGSCREAREYTPGHGHLTCGVDARKEKIYLTPGQSRLYDEIDFKRF
jgi:hypothetical protein